MEEEGFGRGVERRCSTCGALVGIEAEWCGQCLTPLGPPGGAGRAEKEAEVRPAEPAAKADGATERQAKDEGDVRPAAASWPCPSCRRANPLDLDVCAVCGYPFRRLFEEGSPRVEPGRATLWSLAFPGLGHRLVGRGAEGLVRGVLFTWTLGTAVLLAVGWSSRAPALLMAVLYGAAALGIYVLTAAEARRLAAGEGPILSPQALLWGSASLLGVSAVLTIAVISGGGG